MTVVALKKSDMPGDDTIYYVCETPTDRYWWREDWIAYEKPYHLKKYFQ